MATAGDGDGNVSRNELPSAVPFTLSNPSRLRWDLGAHVVECDDAEPHSRWERADSRWAVTITEVTTESVLLRVETPVGRKRMFGVARSELEDVLDALESSPAWQQES